MKTLDIPNLDEVSAITAQYENILWFLGNLMEVYRAIRTINTPARQ
jgi:hypothetical protein